MLCIYSIIGNGISLTDLGTYEKYNNDVYIPGTQAVLAK
jgi:hypothetical protein